MVTSIQIAPLFGLSSCFKKSASTLLTKNWANQWKIGMQVASKTILSFKTEVVKASSHLFLSLKILANQKKC